MACQSAIHWANIFYSVPYGRFSWMKTEKIGKFRICPSRVHRFSRSTIRIKKKNCKKKFLMSSSIGIQKDFFFQSLAEIWTFSSGGTISKSFHLALPFCLFMSFATPSRIFVFSLSLFFVLYMYHTFIFSVIYCPIPVFTHRIFPLNYVTWILYLTF